MNSLLDFYKFRTLIFEVDKYSVEVLITHEILLKNNQSPEIYNMKINGKVIYGKDIRKKLPVKRISKWESIRLVLNRLVSFNLTFWKYKNNGIIEKSDYYNMIKILISIGEFLLINDNKYTPSYAEQLEIFQNKNKDGRYDLIIYGLKNKIKIESINNNYIEDTAILVNNIIKKLKFDLKKYPKYPSYYFFESIKMIKSRRFINIFKTPKIIDVYRETLDILNQLINSNKFSAKLQKKNIEDLIETRNSCPQIQTCFI